MRAVPYLVAWVGILLGTSPAARAQPTIRGILERAIEAHGGQARLARMPAVASRGTGIVILQEKEYAFAAASLVQWPSQFRNEMRLNLDGREVSTIQVLNGAKGWSQAAGQVSPLGELQIREILEQLYAERVATLVGLTHPSFQLQLRGEAPVKGRPAWELKVSSNGHRDIGLFFDKESGLLVKTETRVQDQTLKKEVLQEKIVSEFRTVEGIVSPRRVMIYRNGDKYLEMDVLEYFRLEKLDEALFAPPQ